MRWPYRGYGGDLQNHPKGIQEAQEDKIIEPKALLARITKLEALLEEAKAKATVAN